MNAINEAVADSKGKILQQAGKEHDSIVAEEKKARIAAERALDTQSLRHKQVIDSHHTVTTDLVDKISRLEQEKV